MSNQAALLPTASFEFPSPVCQVQSFAGILQRNLGDFAWSKLHPAIRLRFAPHLAETRALRFVGVMHWVYCSPMGSLIARLLMRFSILPGRCRQHKAFDFVIELNNGVILKQRRYRLDQGAAFTFRSLFREYPRLHEEFGGGIGMYLQLAEEQGALLFRDRGYFLRLGTWRLPLPRWLMVGSFELLHRNIDERRFQVIIRVAHPLFGTLFYQRGEFEADNTTHNGTRTVGH
jgi:hypothetical protein